MYMSHKRGPHTLEIAGFETRPAVQNDLNLPDDGGGAPKHEGSGWQFDSQP